MFMEFKEIFQLVLDAAQGLTWVAALLLVGYGIMQLLLQLGTAWVIYLGCTKLFSSVQTIFATKQEKIITERFDLGGFFITSDGSLDDFKKIIKTVLQHRRPNTYGYRHLHHDDVEWLRDVVEAQIAEERSAKKQ